jgi:hypothetical protein
MQNPGISKALTFKKKKRRPHSPPPLACLSTSHVLTPSPPWPYASQLLQLPDGTPPLPPIHATAQVAL